ncbi:Serine/threonine-protein kinase plk-2 [Frankliniella fusca]|uniref:Serine/threonine-protein kinase plk-2 n=1 Tax=Frankliniella fusca TaxID=407009 RepID=A0AAE1GU57_9NEOP|nr:Serine/threonine-protein kinase plk-2 [Frankliniella fusca]
MASAVILELSATAAPPFESTTIGPVMVASKNFKAVDPTINLSGALQGLKVSARPVPCRAAPRLSGRVGDDDDDDDDKKALFLVVTCRLPRPKRYSENPSVRMSHTLVPPTEAQSCKSVQLEIAPLQGEDDQDQAEELFHSEMLKREHV